jgi:Secretion system C-terminal sorting domain
MKKILLLAALMAVAGLFNQTKAQCAFANAGVRLTATPYTDPNTGNCMIGIDLYFDIKHNPGGKYVYVHIWPANQYADYSYPTTAPPTLTNGGLTNSIATFGFFHQGETVTLLDSYPPDANVPNYQFAGLAIVKTPGILAGSERFTVSGLIVQSAVSCTTPQLFIADAWESQSAQAQNVHCASKGLQFYANDPKIIGLMFCNVPRTYKFDVSTINAAGMTFDYKVYIDNGDRLFNKLQDTLQIGTGSTIVLNAANSYKYISPVLQYEPYSFTKPYADKSLWVVITSTSLTNEVYGRIDNLCITLPVMLKIFTAVRNDNTVNLKWTTETEINNKGFYVERKTTNGDWMTLGFVTSAAPGGNSAGTITYTFSDINIEKTSTLYRLRQVDFGEKANMSETRMVAGKDNEGRVIVYPNPTYTGELNLLFAKGETLSDIKLVNMNGQTVRQWSNFSGTKIYVNNITPGIYNLNVITRGTKEQFNIKVAIK